MTSDAITEAIRAFPFWNYGLNDTDPRSEYAEWVPDLAAAVEKAASVPPPLGDDPDEWPIATSRRGLIAAVRTWLGDIAPGLLADLEHSQVHDAPAGVVYDHLPSAVDELIDHLKGQQEVAR